jgi:hypothetical protein
MGTITHTVTMPAIMMQRSLNDFIFFISSVSVEYVARADFQLLRVAELLTVASLLNKI